MPLRGLSVLVVEDEPVVRMVAAATIQDAGFDTVEVAEEGAADAAGIACTR